MRHNRASGVQWGPEGSSGVQWEGELLFLLYAFYGRENQRILDEKRNLINKDEKKTKKKKNDERIGRKGRVGEGKEEERKKTEKAEKKAEEKAVAAGQSASNSHSFKPLRSIKIEIEKLKINSERIIQVTVKDTE